MFDADESFLFGGSNDPTIGHNRRGSVSHVGQSQCQHGEKNNRTLVRLQDETASNCFLACFSGTVINRSSLVHVHHWSRAL